MTDRPDAAMGGPEAAWWNAAAFFRVWKGPFVGALDALRTVEKSGADALATASRELGGAIPVMPPAVLSAGDADATPVASDDVTAILAALEARVADLAVLGQIEAHRKRVIDVYDRATAAGPLGPWAARLKDALPRVDALVVEATPASLVAARTELEALLRDVDTLRAEHGRRVDANAEAGDEAIAAFDEVIRIARQEARTIEGQVTLDARRIDEWRAGMRGLFGFPTVLGAVGAGIGFLRGGPTGAQQGVAAGVGVGLVVAVAAWAFRAWRARGRFGDRVKEARALAADVRHAQEELERDLTTLQREARALVVEGAELGVTRSIGDHREALARLAEPAEPAELTALNRALAAGPGPNTGLRAAAVIAVIGVGIAAFTAPRVVPAESAAPQTTAELPPSGPVRPGAEPAPPEPVAAVPDAPALPTDAPTDTPAAPRFASGAWSGTLGPARVSGTLTTRGSSLDGTLRIEAPEGMRECAVTGAISGTKLTLASTGCAPAVTLAGRLQKGGTSLSGTGTSTVTFDGHTVKAQDIWAMKAESP